jgi:cation transport ATPase
MRMPDEMSHAVNAPGLNVKPGGRRVLILSGAAVELAMKPEHRRELVDRLFSIPALAGLTMDLEAGRARLRFQQGAGRTPELLRSVAKAMRLPKPEHLALAELDLIEVLSSSRRLELERIGGRLTFLRIKPLRPGRYRFFHPELRNPAARNAVLSHLMGVAYLKRQIASGLMGGYVEVEFENARMTIDTLVDALEAALLGTIGSASRHHHWQPIHFRRQLVNTNLVLAVLSDFLLPPARLFSVVTLWMLNVRHARPALRAIRELKVNLDLLYSTIACLTLLSVSFIASGVMYWMLDFWPRRVKQLRETESRKFLASLNRCPRSVWVERNGTEMEMPVRQLRLGDTVILREGDVAPGDGRATSGHALVAESWSAGLHQKRAGDIIHCSGRIASGETRITLETLGAGHATALLAEWHAQALAAPVSKDRVHRMATSAVLPAIALAALALLRNGVSMAKCMTRPDYVTGPLIARELGWAASVMEAARNGLLIRNDAALEKLAQCDCFIFSADVRWRPGASNASEIASALRELGVEEILIPAGDASGSSALSTIVHGIGETRPVDSTGLIKERQYLGRQVAFIGDCETHAEAAALADIAVHVSHPPFLKPPPTDIALFEPELQGVLALRGIATGYNDRLRGSFATALIPNVACIIGALYLGLPILGVVALTNAGTLASYLQAGRALRAASTGPAWD